MSELKLGATYQHYKTKGVYVPLQLVQMHGTTPDEHTMFLRSVKFTGDGQLDGVAMELCYSIQRGVLFVLHRPLPDGVQPTQVLYYSQSAKDYFVRPLHEFVEWVQVDMMDKAPRFKLVTP